jgi:long-chain acyl-CoA synthetase
MSQTQDSMLTAITKQAEIQPEAIALRLIGDDIQQAVTFEALQKAIQERAEYLKKIGIRPGDRVVLLGKNSPEWLFYYFALIQIEATVVLLDSKQTDEELHQLVQRVEPILLILEAQRYAKSNELFPGILYLQMETEIHSVTEKSSTEILANATRPDDIDPSIAAIVFTSGSTAQPKGVVLSRENVDHALEGVIQRTGLSDSSNMLCVLPFHHVLGLGTCMAVIKVGGTATLLHEPRGELLLKAMKLTNTTVLPGPPRLFELLLTNINHKIKQMPAPVRPIISAFRWITRLIRARSNFNPGKVLFRKLHEHFGGHLELLIAGGAALPKEVCQELEEFGFDMIEGYGLTETTGAVSINTLEHNRAGTVGHAFPGLEVCIGNQNISGEGEIWVRGPTNMQGYFHDPKATMDIFREDGWLRTGDIGRIDREGFLSITGRIKELIVTSAGKNVAPEAVEWHYRNIPEILEMAVLGMPSPTRYGEEIHAAVVPLKHDQDAEQRIDDAIKARSDRVPSYQQIQRIHIVNDIPRTTTFKVRRSVLRQKLLEKTDEILIKSNLDGIDDMTQKVIRIVRGVVESKNTSLNIEPSSALMFDLGIDSLGFMELLSSLRQEFNIDLDIIQIQTCKTIGDLTQLIQQLSEKAQPITEKASVYDSETPSIPFQIPPPYSASAMVFFRVIRKLFKWLWAFEVEGLDNLPKEGPLILCPNHESHFDVIFVTSCLPPKYQKTLCTFAKRELFDRFMTRLIVKAIRAIPVDRKGDPRLALEMGITLLKAGRPVFIHPEGTRTRNGALKPFRRGAAHLSLQTGVPLIPVRIKGAFNIYPPHARFPKLLSFQAEHPLHLKIHFGKPIAPPPDTLDAATQQMLTDQLRHAIEKL